MKKTKIDLMPMLFPHATVLVGERITARIEVTSVRDDRPICTLLTEVRNGNGDICLTGSATTYTMPLKPLGLRERSGQTGMRAQVMHGE